MKIHLLRTEKPSAMVSYDNLKGLQIKNNLSHVSGKTRRRTPKGNRLIYGERTL